MTRNVTVLINSMENVGSGGNYHALRLIAFNLRTYEHSEDEKEKGIFENAIVQADRFINRLPYDENKHLTLAPIRWKLQ